jgi:putative lipoic acid-binding regulatory protein
MKAPDYDLMQFPCAFPIKAMSRGIIGIEQTIVGIIRKHTEEADINSVKVQPSRKGKYVSVTVVITARSREQLDEIYMGLTHHPDVIISF